LETAKGGLRSPIITSGALADHLGGRPIDPRLIAEAWAFSIRQGFFHWLLEFPEVFADGGFDVVLSNPPWERVKLQEQEFFSAHDARIANAPTKAARGKLIRELPKTNPALHQKFVEALRAASGVSSILRHGGRFLLTGRGDINTYAVFAELCRGLIGATGRCGIIVPTGFATDDTTKLFFQDLVQKRQLLSYFGFKNERFLFPKPVEHTVTFGLLTVLGAGLRADQMEFTWLCWTVAELKQPERRIVLDAEDFSLLNPNTGNCPIFRTQADAELTKAIYRRVPVLWREAVHGQLEANPWRLSFSRMFDMANDSHHFRTAKELEADGYRREGNVFISPYDRYLPLCEAKMLHQFDHRFSTYEGATEKQLNVGILPQPSAEQKRDPSFMVQPRYWIREEVVESTIPKYPEPLATALQVEHRPSMQYVLALWAAGFYLERGDKEQAARMLHVTTVTDLDRAVAQTLGEGTEEYYAKRLTQDFPLTEADVQAIAVQLDVPESLARDLVERFSPKWFLGWRDICRSTDQRTLIASAVPRVAVGHKFLLLLSKAPPSVRVLLLANMASFVLDYCARQKIGGTSMSYFVLRQLPVLPPDHFGNPILFAAPPLSASLQDWLTPRVLELTYTAHDLALLARACGYDGPPSLGMENDASRFAANWTPPSSTSICHVTRMVPGARPMARHPSNWWRSSTTSRGRAMPWPISSTSSPSSGRRTSRLTAATAPKSASLRSTTPCSPPSATASLTKRS
jgi:hypothetical protein